MVNQFPPPDPRLAPEQLADADTEEPVQVGDPTALPLAQRRCYRIDERLEHPLGRLLQHSLAAFLHLGDQVLGPESLRLPLLRGPGANLFFHALGVLGHPVLGQPRTEPVRRLEEGGLGLRRSKGRPMVQVLK